MIGKLLDHYQITEKLGEGGMGKVYCAGCSVPLCLIPFKVPHHKSTISIERLDRFEYQIRLWVGKESQRG